jgi:ACS family D-galactonate transporter-like MFS transporter
VSAFGWRALFVAAGIAGILFALVWLRLYRDPHESQSVNAAELAYIEVF